MGPLDITPALEAEKCTIEPCGSRVTCNPPPVGTDQDFLVVVPPREDVVSRVVGHLSTAGYHWEGSEHYQIVAGNDFMSWRKGDVNLIVTASPTFTKRHRAATHVCKRLNLLSKDDRVALFQAVLYGVQWEAEGDCA